MHLNAMFLVENIVNICLKLYNVLLLRFMIYSLLLFLVDNGRQNCSTHDFHVSIFIFHGWIQWIDFYRPLPQWMRMKTGSRIRYNAKRRHWRRTKLKLWEGINFITLYSWFSNFKLFWNKYLLNLATCNMVLFEKSNSGNFQTEMAYVEVWVELLATTDVVVYLIDTLE